MRDMKDSGVEWIGDIPARWSVVRLKTRFYFGKGLPITKENLIENGIPVISYGQIHARFNPGTKIVDELIRFVPRSYLSSNPESLVNEGDILMADTSEDVEGCGNCVYVDKEMLLFAGYHTIILKSVNRENKYLAYLFKTDAWRSQIRSQVSGVKLFSITKKILSSVTIILPPLPEQIAIASYVDEKCSRIDAIITAHRKIIEKLKEYKSSLITETVTKGLDPEAELKDSGVEWIGKIPAGWSVQKIKRSFKIYSGATPKSEKPEYWGGSIVWITPADYKTEDKYVAIGKKTLTEEGYESCNTIIVPMGSIIFSKRAPVGTVAINKIPLCTNQGCLSCVPNDGVNVEYFYYTMSVFTEQFELYSSGTTFMEISAASFANFILPFPPFSEQIQISAYLDDKCAKIDLNIRKRELVIEKFTEYKKSLIYEAVTGKKEI